ncbi:MAG: hypothetical protein ACI89L_002849 [Phycisphaerales bacterium]|jgi:hypothetical protein
MPSRVAYLMRDDRGGRLCAVRLITERSDDEWSGERFGAREAVPAAEDAAGWLANRCESFKTRSIETLCVDPDGAACSWLSVTSTDATALRNQIESHGVADTDDDGFGEDHGFESHSGRFPDMPGELAVEALPMTLATGGKPAAVAARLPVLAVPDATVRLLLDALDRRGVRVESVCSLWHAAAMVWDPASPMADHGIRARADRVVASDHPVTAVVLIDPLGERLVWSWASGGNLVAAGSMRVRTAVDRDVQRLGLDTVGEIDRRAVLTDAEIGRLTQDWLSWSAQIGVAPSRVVCVGSPAAIGDDGMSPPRVGEAIAARWPETSVDIIDEPDAVGATLHRFAGNQEAGEPEHASPHTQLVSLTRRPGSTHRSLYRWAGVSMVVAGLGLAWIAWNLYGRAGQYADQRAGNDARISEILGGVDSTLVGQAFPQRQLETKVAALRQRLAPTDTQAPPPPVLETFDTLSLVLGTPGLQLVEMSLSTRAVSLKINTPGRDLQTAETLAASLDSIEGLPINWATPGYAQQTVRGEDSIRATYSGNWINPATTTPARGGNP